MQNVVAVIVLVSIAWAFWRRLVTKPARLTYNRDALVILAMIGGVVLAELLAEVFEFARLRRPARRVRLRGPRGRRSGPALAPATLETAFAVLWWAHIVLVAAFLVYLPFSKHLHIATAFPNVWYRKLRPRGELPAMDLEREDATFGLKTLQDLGWKDLLDGFTCTECGRCQEACPAWNTGKPLNPKTFIMGIRDMSIEAEHGLDLIPNSRSSARRTASTTRPRRPPMAAPIVDEAIPYDAVWDCVTCGACVEACPVLIEHVDKIVGLRRNLVLEESRFPPELTGAFRAMEGQGNPWGQPASTRDRTGRRACRSRSRRSPDLAAAPGGLDEPRGPLLGRLRGRVRRAQPARRPGLRDVPRRGRRPVRDPRPGGVVHRRPGPPDGQRLRLPDPRQRQRRDAQPVRDGRADDRDRLPALLQHDRQRVPAARRLVPGRPPLGVPAGAARRRAAARSRTTARRRRRSRSTTRAT